MGDFNIDICRDNQVTRSFVERANSSGFSLSNFEPTRVATSRETCIDHILTSDITVISGRVHKNASFPDRYAVTIDIALKNVLQDFSKLKEISIF